MNGACDWRQRCQKVASMGRRGRGFLEQRHGGGNEQEVYMGTGGSQDSGVVGLGCGAGVCEAFGRYFKLVEVVGALEVRERHDSIWVWITLAAGWRWLEGGEDGSGQVRRRLVG